MAAAAPLPALEARRSAALDLEHHARDFSPPRSKRMATTSAPSNCKLGSARDQRFVHREVEVAVDHRE
eukprot:3628729-Pyramimonas_sp.AAC.1